MANDIEHLFVCSSDTSMSSPVEYHFISFAHLLIELFAFLLLSFERSLWILEIGHLRGVWLANIFFYL